MYVILYWYYNIWTCISVYGNGDENLGDALDVRVTGQLMVPTPTEMPDSYLPIHVEMRSDIFDTQRVLEFAFPFRTVVKGMVIDTDPVMYLKSFNLQVSRSDHVAQGVFSDVEYIMGQPIVSINKLLVAHTLH